MSFFAWQAWHFVTLKCVRRNVCVCVCAAVMRVKLPCLWGEATKNVSFSTCQKMWSCRFAWQAWHFVTLKCVRRNVCVCVCAAIVRVKLPCLWGEATKMCLSPHVRRCGHVVLRGRRGTLWHSTCFKCVFSRACGFVWNKVCRNAYGWTRWTSRTTRSSSFSLTLERIFVTLLVKIFTQSVKF